MTQAKLAESEVVSQRLDCGICVQGERVHTPSAFPVRCTCNPHGRLDGKFSLSARTFASNYLSEARRTRAPRCVRDGSLKGVSLCWGFRTGCSPMALQTYPGKILPGDYSKQNSWSVFYSAHYAYTYEILRVTR